MSRGLFWYLGTDDIKFEAGVASESMITSQAHSIVVLRFADEKQAADAAAKLKTTVDPRKWICVGVDAVSYTHLDVYKRQGRRRTR